MIVTIATHAPDAVAGPTFGDADTAEIYGQLGYGPVYAKYSLSLTNQFGFVDSRNSGYLDLGANLDLGHSLTLNLYADRQDVRHHDAASYTDYKVDFPGISVAPP